MYKRNSTIGLSGEMQIEKPYENINDIVPSLEQKMRDNNIIGYDTPSKDKMLHNQLKKSFDY